MQALAARFDQRLLLLVQNLHHLPFGPSGCAAPTPGLLASWRAAGGCIVVSEFVREYLLQHAVPLGLASPERVCVVRLSAWGCFGAPPFEDLGGRRAQQLATQQQQQARQRQQRQERRHTPEQQTSDNRHLPCMGAAALVSARAPAPAAGVLAADAAAAALQPLPAAVQLPPAAQQLPTIGMLKLSLDKGASVFAQLAERLRGRYAFVAVAADDDARALRAAGQLPGNVQLLVPQEDVGAALAHMWLVLVPSLLPEAFGMVVVDAMLRGIPVIISNAGALPEAALGAAGAVVPVRQVQLPDSDAAGGGARRFAQRMHPEQDVGSWAAAVERLLGDEQAYAEASTAARAAAAAFVRGGDQELATLAQWLARLHKLQ